jgi:hypothetical protein
VRQTRDGSMRFAAIAKGINGRRKEARTTTQGQKGVRALVVGRASTSALGTFETCRRAPRMSALKGISEVRFPFRQDGFDPQPA